MTTTRIWIPIGSFLVALIVIVAATLLPFIPTWENARLVTALMAMLGALVSGVFLGRGIFLSTQDRMKIGFRAVLVVATSVLLLGILYVAAFVIAFSFSGGFAAKFDHELYYADYGTTLYVYDDGFLDPATKVTYHSGIFPFEHQIGYFGNLYPGDLVLAQSGEWVESDRFKFNLATHEIVRLEP